MRQSPIDLAFGASVRGTFDDFVFHDYDQPIRDAKVTNNGHSSEFCFKIPGIPETNFDQLFLVFPPNQPF